MKTHLAESTRTAKVIGWIEAHPAICAAAVPIGLALAGAVGSLFSVLERQDYLDLAAWIVAAAQAPVSLPLAVLVGGVVLAAMGVVVVTQPLVTVIRRAVDSAKALPHSTFLTTTIDGVQWRWKWVGSSVLAHEVTGFCPVCDLELVHSLIEVHGDPTYWRCRKCKENRSSEIREPRAYIDLIHKEIERRGRALDAGKSVDESAAVSIESS